MPAAGMLARSWLAPESPWGSDVQDNLKSPSLCDLARCRHFYSWLFQDHVCQGLATAFAAPGGTLGTATGDEPCGLGRGCFHPASLIPPWAAHV